MTGYQAARPAGGFVAKSTYGTSFVVDSSTTKKEVQMRPLDNVGRPVDQKFGHMSMYQSDYLKHLDAMSGKLFQEKVLE